MVAARADTHPNHPVAVFDGDGITMTHERQHGPVVEQHLGLEVPDALGGGPTHQHVEEVGAEPSTPRRRDRDGQIAVAVLANGVARLGSYDRFAAAGVSDEGDHTETAALAHGRPFPTPLDSRRERPEEPTMPIGQRELLVEGTDPVGIVQRHGAHRHRTTVGEIDHVDHVVRRCGHRGHDLD